jgi:putative transposase
MPWKETFVMDEKMKFVAMLLDGEKMTYVCEQFGISRKTGYKIWNRYQNVGAKALMDRSRKPHRFSNQLPEQIERTIVRLKKDKIHWGAAKIRELLVRKYPHLHHPAVSTVHAVLDRYGLVNCRSRRRKNKAQGTALSESLEPNDIWCTDFKGEFMLGDRRYCYPLTITDHLSRYLITVEGLESVREDPAIAIFERTFEEFGLPAVIRSDNGVPFATANGLFGLSRMSVWWLRLGIGIERIKPGHPEQNGRHERMHRTLKQETVKPAGRNFLQQQEKFDFFQNEFNKERPHQALSMKTPAEIYKPSTRRYVGIGNLEYPLHDKVITVTSCGRICHKGLKISFSTVFRGQDVGIREVDSQLWQVSYMDYDLGFFDEKSGRFEPGANPFASKL